MFVITTMVFAHDFSLLYGRSIGHEFAVLWGLHSLISLQLGLHLIDILVAIPFDYRIRRYGLYLISNDSSQRPLQSVYCLYPVRNPLLHHLFFSRYFTSHIVRE